LTASFTEGHAIQIVRTLVSTRRSTCMMGCMGRAIYLATGQRAASGHSTHRGALVLQMNLP
jgi:hypothetical protein